MSDSDSTSAPDVSAARTIRLRTNSRVARVAKRLGLGELREKFNRWDTSTKRVVHVKGGMFLTESEFALASVESEKSTGSEGSSGSAIKPPHDAKEKARKQFVNILEYIARTGGTLTPAVRKKAWRRAHRTYGLAAEGKPPPVEITVSFADRIAEIAVSRVDADGDTDEPASDRAKRLGSARRSKRGSRGSVGNVLNRR